MQRVGNIKKTVISALFIMTVGVIGAPNVHGDTCVEGLATPPFLGIETVPPNVLLMMDNSASMYDANYVEDVGYCFADNYDNDRLEPYAGIFLTVDEMIKNVTVIWEYDEDAQEYVRTDAADVAANCQTVGATEARYNNSFLCTIIDEPDPADPSTHAVKYFAATGKFLNWLTSTKMDIQKLILTGGKWENNQLIAESRGCLGRKMIKEVPVNGGVAKLTFAVNGDKENEDDDSPINPNNTLIDVYAVSAGGFDNDACQRVITGLQSPTGVGGIKRDLDACLGGFPNNSPEGDMVSAFNLSIQDCWYMAKFGVDDWRSTFSSAAIRNQCEKLYEGNPSGPYPGTFPWLLPDDISALVCRGKYDDPAFPLSFVGRCYIPAGHPPVMIPFNEDGDQEELLAGFANGYDQALAAAQDGSFWGNAPGNFRQDKGNGQTQPFFMGELSEEIVPRAFQAQPEKDPRPIVEKQQVGLDQEKKGVIEALTEFINTGGRNQLARSRVLKAVYDFFVADVNAAAGVVEETAAACTDTWTGVPGASGGSAIYHKKSGPFCEFPLAGVVADHGLYNVEVIAPCDGLASKRNDAVAVSVNHVGVPTAYTWNQEIDCTATGDPENWITIPGGPFEFDPAVPASITILSNSVTNKFAYADAVKLTLDSVIGSPPPKIGSHPYVASIIPTTLSPTDSSTISFEVTFSEPVCNFNDENDLIVSETATLSHTGVTINGACGDQVYTVDVNNVTGEGLMRLRVKSWVRDWQENSVAGGTFDEISSFIIAGPYPANIQLGKYEVRVTDTVLTNAVVTNFTQGYTTLTQPRNGPFLDYPNDTGCCDGFAPADFCCTYPLGIGFTHYMTSGGWSDGWMGSGLWNEWQKDDTITYAIVPASDITNGWGSIVSFGVLSDPVARIAPIVETCVPPIPAGPTWWCDSCIEEAIIDFCGQLSVPEVIDPSDQSSLAGEGQYWNIPALMWDQAADAQLDDAIDIGRSEDYDEDANGNGVFDPGVDSDCDGDADDANGDGTLDLGEDLDDDCIFDVANGILDAGEDLDGDGELDVARGFMVAKVRALHEDLDNDGELDAGEDIDGDGRLDTRPEGLIQEFGDRVRFGLMAFKGNGDLSECGDYDLFTNCAADGAIIDVEIGDNDYTHAQAVADAMNDRDAETWTPMAEAVYTAIGYYTQDPSMRLVGDEYVVNSDAVSTKPWTPGGPKLDPGDIVEADGVFYMTPGGGWPSGDATNPMNDEDVTDWVVVNDPIIAYCQRNFVVVITEGASTADLNPTVAGFVSANNDGDAEQFTTGCDVLKGSTYFDDLVDYAWTGTNIYDYEQFPNGNKNNVEFHIVNTTSPRGGLVGECNPYANLEAGATNTNLVAKDEDKIINDIALYWGGNPAELYRAMRRIFENIITQTSSGSAASVISASRSGEGALYQALFWPATETKLPGREFTLWTGEVHSFLVDSEGNLREDTIDNGRLDAGDEPVVIYFDQVAEVTQACLGEIDADAGLCLGTSKALDAVNYLWSTTDWLNREAIDNNIAYNRDINVDGTYDFTGLTNKDKRYIFTWNDLDNDGAVDHSTEILPFVENFGAGIWGFPDEGDGGDPMGRAPVEADFQVEVPASVVDDPLTPEFEPAVYVEDRVNEIINWVRGQDLPPEDLNGNGVLDAGEDTNGNGVLDEGLRERAILGDNDGDGLVGLNEAVIWKLGDVVHSTPLSVAKPAENYHLLYRDITYAEFYTRWENRRHMVYFGANDGMLHAMNGGFFTNDLNNDRVEDDPMFCLTKECVIDPGTDTEVLTGDEPELGLEMWAYVPYNLIPHLKCLTEPNYEHKYFVDLRPRIFDARIFKEEAACSDPTKGIEHEECEHVNGWGTILVGGMRYGGPPARIDYWVDTDGDSVPDKPDNREFTSAYFILDITNPEKPPVLLGEMTKLTDPEEDANNNGVLDAGEDLNGNGRLDREEADLGYTTVISTMVPMFISQEDLPEPDPSDPALPWVPDGNLDAGEDKNCNNSLDDEVNKWYLVLGSGPTGPSPEYGIDGTSTQNARISVVPLDRLVDTAATVGDGSDPVLDMRIPAALPNTSDEFGTFELSDTASFTSDLITVDLETYQDYLADVVYFGTVQGNWAAGWGGKMNRMVVRDWKICDGLQTQLFSPPSSWRSLYEPTTTPIMPLIDVEQPITTAATVGTDGVDFWVYFGTGRFFDIDDKTNEFSNSIQTFYGIKEPVSNDAADLSFLGVLGAQPATPPCQLSWSQVWNDRPLYQSPPGAATGGLQPDGVTPLTAGQRANLGLAEVGGIEILSSESIDEPATLQCKDGTDPFDPGSCLEDLIVAYNAQYGVDPELTYRDLVWWITGDYVMCTGNFIGLDGWYRDLEDERERNLGQASLLGGLLTYSTYQPYTRDLCQSEGTGYLYGLYYLTGTPWFEDIFGTIDADSDPRTANPDRMALGKGLSTTPNIHVGEEEGGKAFIQTSVGKIREIPQPNLPDKNVKSGRVKWRDIER
jgi:Tfp pilus tip-associated adhesin PilY1